MAKYKETSVSGTSSNYFASIRIENYFSSPAVIEAKEVKRTELDSGTVVETDAGTVSFVFDPAYEFPVLNPVTREPTGETASGITVYSLIQSYLLAKVSEPVEQPENP